MTSFLRRTFHLVALLVVAGAATAATPKGPAPIEGEDYVRIEGGAPFAPVKGTVEVVEAFSYTCNHCAALEPLLAMWAKGLPKNARLVPLPVSFGGPTDLFARAYFAGRALKAPASAHGALFKALHEQGSVPLRNPSESEIAAFYTRYNLAPAKFVQTMQSKAIGDQAQRAQAFLTRAGIEGTPSLIVNGRYRITARSREDTLRVADHLIALESRRR